MCVYVYKLRNEAFTNVVNVLENIFMSIIYANI